ncbi:hypothetical protein CRG98_022417 [Punica granatum]|uniref:Transposase MuDR plant domain-containing protein n=1 Tax=Punica granatum TaxID=22663 RepID=A0A2I0JLL5_PUNGR|nr:hypothetical protein CRG98_022417 [Punica granatum]
MERMRPEVRDRDEENDDMKFEQSTQPGLEKMESANANVETSRVRVRKKFVVVKKRKQKEKGNINIAMERQVDFMKNDKARVRAYCVEKKDNDGCQWKIYRGLNKKTNTYQVMTYDPEHTCARKIENKLAIKEWIVEKLIPWLRTQ